MILHSIHEVAIAPFYEFAFMRRALVATFALALGSGPVGVLLVVRRMSLVGDAMAHAVLPGAAVGFFLGGFSIWAMGAGGLIAGFLVSLLAGFVTRKTAQREDASFAAFYLISLALGVLLVSAHGSSVDLMHMLFGSILGVDNAALVLLACIASFTLITLSITYRGIILESFDSQFLKAQGSKSGLFHNIFLVLVVLNLVGGFQALGTLMAVGLIMLPAISARFIAKQLWSQAITASSIAFLSGYLGLLLSFQYDLASGPCIVLCSGTIYLVALFAVALGGILSLRKRPHLRT